MDREAWRAAVHGVTKSRTQLLQKLGGGVGRALAHPSETRAELLDLPWTMDMSLSELQAPLSMEFFRQEYWSGLPFPSPGDLPDPGIEPGSSALQAHSLHLISQEPSMTLQCLPTMTGWQTYWWSPSTRLLRTMRKIKNVRNPC